MIILNDKGKLAGREVDGDIAVEDTPAGEQLANWLRVGVPVLRGRQADDEIIEVEEMMVPDEPFFGLALLEHFEDVGWVVREEGTKDYRPNEKHLPGGHNQLTHGRGGGGSEHVSLEESKKRYEEHWDEFKSQQGKINDLYGKYESNDPKVRVSIAADKFRAGAARDMARYDAVTERMSHEAIDPVGYREARAKQRKMKEDWNKENAEMIEDFVAAGVTNNAYYHGMDSIGSHGGYKGAAPHYPNLTEEQFGRARKMFEKRSEQDRLDDDISAAYYGEPKTVRNLDYKLGEVGSIPSKVGQGGADEDMKAFMGQAQVGIQVSEAAMNRIASQGKMKNGFEGGAVKGVGKGKRGYYDHRRDSESEIFGIPHNAPAEGRPIYGYLEHPDRLASHGARVGTNYGAVQVVLKNEVKSRTTYTVGDSIDDGRIHTNHAGAVNNPTPPTPHPGRHVIVTNNASSWKTWPDEDPGWKITPKYVEAQIHGGIKASDIAEVRVPRYTKLTDRSMKKLEKLGVSVVVVPPAMRGIYTKQPWDEVFEEED